MNVFTDNTRNEGMEGRPRPVRWHRGPAGPVPPHERKEMFRIEYDGEDLALLTDVFGDEDTAAAAMEVIMEAPPEIQVLAVQLISIIREEDR